MSSLNAGHGVIATLVSAEGATRVAHVPVRGETKRRGQKRVAGGGSEDAMRVIIRLCDEHDLRVRTVSTPSSIARDLQGSRAQAGRANQLDLPEAFMLGRLGRMDLLETQSGRYVRKAS